MGYLICLVIGACIGAFGMGIIAGGKIESLQIQLDSLPIDGKCGDCDENKRLKKSCDALRGDNLRMYNIIRARGRELNSTGFLKDGFKSR